MIVLRVKLDVQKEHLAETIELFKILVKASRSAEGTIAYDICQDILCDTTLIVTEVYEDEEALQRHFAMPEFGEVLGKVEPFLSAKPDGTIFNVESSKPLDL
ncbi:MAG: antibiotic biosynthesis monooxygenase [Calditrichaeota bacterium]|nr:MAG: antibiotic biosynthesis monooxygenase [Calditrichota bacterium]